MVTLQHSATGSMTVDQSAGSSIGEVFARHGLRCTRQRRALYEALSATKAHPTADELYHDVVARVRGVSLATVYNTLEAFCDVGLAQKLPANGGSARYDATVDNHLHLRCEQTDAVRDVPEDLGQNILDHLPQELLQKLQHEMGFEIHQIQIQLIGAFKNGVPAVPGSERARL